MLHKFVLKTKISLASAILKIFARIFALEQIKNIVQAYRYSRQLTLLARTKINLNKPVVNSFDQLR